ncbi:MAG: DEAD/DEAH box helicase [Polyangiaceae bacterium]
MTTPSLDSVLETLPRARLVELGRTVGVGLEESANKEHHVATLKASGQLRLPQIVAWMYRDELRRACERHGLSAKERARPVLASRLLEAAGAAESARPVGLFGARPFARHAPRVGDVVQARQRQYLVERVAPPPEPTHATLVDLVCLDDDNQGRPLSVLWELELGARVLHPDAEGLGKGPITKLDPPRHFAAYLHALRWNTVTATDGRLFQSPFRAGIKLLNHQLTPLKKALELPRANLFIADDVGLGKTIEAGLVMQELELRQRVDFVLIVCPASICLQWKGEMERRFGQRFEVYDRELMAQRRRERGFGVVPWATHNRFIISYQTLRRPEYFEPLIQHLGDRLRKSLLVLDEAHTAAPASSSKYAIDSRTTGVVRDLAPRFENRLFLSATP